MNFLSLTAYVPALLFLFACFLFGINSRYSISGRTNTFAWHITQWTTFLVVIVAAFLFGYAYTGSYHDFGEIVSVALMGPFIYVRTLHYKK